MKSASRRIAHYLVKTGVNLIGIDADAILPQQQANYAARLEVFYPRQVLCAGILDTEGITPVMRFAYQAFNNACYRTWLSSSGDSLDDELTRLSSLFEERGLIGSVLARIANEIWASTAVIVHVSPIAFTFPVTSFHGLVHKLPKGTIENDGALPCDAICRLRIFKKALGIYTEDYLESIAVNDMLPGLAPVEIAATLGWTPRTAGTYRGSVNAFISGTAEVTGNQVNGPDFDVIVP